MKRKNLLWKHLLTILYSVTYEYRSVCPICTFTLDADQAQIYSAARCVPISQTVVAKALVGLYREIVSPPAATKDLDNFHELIWRNELIDSVFRREEQATHSPGCEHNLENGYRCSCRRLILINRKSVPRC